MEIANENKGENGDNKRPLVIYHANCVDGMGAAWAARRYFQKNCDLHPASYGTLPPMHIAGRDIYVVDFSYPKEALDFIGNIAHSITVLDHHKTAAADLKDIPQAGVDNIHQRLACPLVRIAIFDMARSGAGITWDFFNPNVPRPKLISHIEDRDLWKFDHPNTRSIHAAIASWPTDDFERFDQLVWEAEGGGYDALVAQGEAIDRRHLQMVRENISSTLRTMNIGGLEVPVCNAPYSLASDTGNLLCKGKPFAATYIDTPKGRAFSLRSSDEGHDVSEIAKRYGGGGHRNAAGFSAEAGWEGE
jgi:oligoribonuclease NrnB/cAMP/cGMP phosphodiesterase (DHH superfamily)